MYIICDQRKSCKYANQCGGAKKHRFEEGECNKCPMDSGAKCVPWNNEGVESSLENRGKIL